MKINSVSCKQFAGLRNMKPVTFEDGLNILYGPNESGKSTLVGLIYSLLWQGSKIHGTRDKDYKSMYFPAEVRSGVRGNTIDGKLVMEDNGESYTISKKWAATGSSGELEVPGARLDEMSDANTYVVSRSHPGLIDLFVSQTRRELAQQEKEKKVSIMEKLAVKPEEKAKTGKEYDRSR